MIDDRFEINYHINWPKLTSLAFGTQTYLLQMRTNECWEGVNYYWSLHIYDLNLRKYVSTLVFHTYTDMQRYIKKHGYI